MIKKIKAYFNSFKKKDIENLDDLDIVELCSRITHVKPVEHSKIVYRGICPFCSNEWESFYVYQSEDRFMCVICQKIGTRDDIPKMILYNT